MSLIDTKLELLPSWENHVGPDIGGIVPTTYGSRIVPGAREFYIAGAPYSDFLAAVHRPIAADNGFLTLAFEVMTDFACRDQAQALEFDVRLARSGFNYNGSAQLNYAEKGMFQIVDNKQAWIDTGSRPGKLAPIFWYPVRIRYLFDFFSRKCSVLSACIGEQSFAIPAGLQSVPATPSNWADSCSLQIQLDLANAPGAFSIFLRNANFIWE